MAPPSDWSIGGLVVPPLLLSALVGWALAMLAARVAAATGLIRYVWHPWLAFVALTLLFTALVALFVIPSV